MNTSQFSNRKKLFLVMVTHDRNRNRKVGNGNVIVLETDMETEVIQRKCCFCLYLDRASIVSVSAIGIK